MQESSFDTGSVTINYAIGATSEPPLVLVHGGSARWQNFESILPELAAHWQIYAPDLRGHGKSGWAPEQYRLQDYTADLIAWLEQCITEPAHIFGHSLGGMIALMVAAQAPEAVRSLVVGDAPLSGTAWQAILEADRERLIALRDLAGGAVPPEQIDEALKNAPLMLPGRSAPITMREAPQHVRLHGIGHALHNEQPAPVLDAIAAFLSAH
jgi:pimeloyl-ACP methyl ester carboxylesterase